MKLEKIYDSSFDSELKLPRLISDGMVLQRDTKIKIWGWAALGEMVTVDFIGKSYSVITNPKGKCEVILYELQA